MKATTATATAILSFFLSGFAHATPSSGGWASVIVQWKSALTPGQEQALTSLHADRYRHLSLIQADALRVPVKNLARLKSLAFVKHVSLDLDCRKNDEYSVGATGADAAFTQSGLTGSGVTVAVLDSGVQMCRLDIQGRTLAAVNFAGDADTTDDLCGHGTHVAGIVAGSGAASSGPGYFRTFYGIARQAGLVDVRVLDAQGRGAVSDVVTGIQWTVANKSVYNIRVLNLSLGHPVGESYTTDPLCQAVEAAWRAGIVVVCAAGNQGRLHAQPGGLLGALAGNEGYGTAYGSIQSPANDPDVITVGAMKSMDGQRRHDKITTYSSRGPSRLDFVLKPDIVAPGNRLISISAKNSYLATNYGYWDAVAPSEYSTVPVNADETYLRLSGTSMAAPVVSGAAALLLQADPTLSPDTVKARLMISADKTGYAGAGDIDACTFGAGYLDIPGALQCPYTATRPSRSPALVRGLLGLVTINTAALMSGGSGVWGTGLNLTGVWGSQVIWGENSLSGSQVIWGESVWGSQVIWGESMSGDDLSTTALIGDPDALKQGPLSFLFR